MIVAAMVLLAAAPLPPALAGFPGVRVVTYPVRGASVAAIRASLDAARPTDANDGEAVEAVTHWHFTWQWPALAGGGCALDAAQVGFTATVTLPQLADPGHVSRAVLTAWRRYRGALERHEAGHVRYAYEHRNDVLEAIRGATCDTADAAGQAVVSAIVAHDLAYDRDTQHGRLQGATFP